MRGRYIGYALVILGAIVIGSTPWFADNYIIRMCTITCMFFTLALSWNFIGGYAGYPSFATGAFFGFGAYAGALFQLQGVPMVLAWVLATLVTGAVAFALGFVVLRLRGHYFAVGSIALLELFRLVASSWTSLTGGGSGLNVPFFPGAPELAAQVFLFAMLGLALICFAVAAYVDRSPIGFGLNCIRQNEQAASMVGIDSMKMKVIAFTLSALFVSTAGAIYASWVSYIDPTDMFDVLTTIKVPVMALLGGAGTLFGPLVGVLAFQILEERLWSNLLDFHTGALGLVIVLLVFLLPGGVLRIAQSPLGRWFSRSEAKRS